MAKKVETAKVVQVPEKVVERNVLAQSVVDISRAFTNLMKTGLTRDAIVILAAARVRPTDRQGHKPTKRDITSVLNAIASLEREFVRESK